jgi:heat shock protein 1/8
MDDPSVQNSIKYCPFEIIGKDGRAHVKVEFKGETNIFCPEEISAMILAKLKESAEAYLDKSVKHAVITVPAYFNYFQLQATRNAAVIAGLNVMRIISNNSAAAITLSLHKRTESETKFLIFNLGGGTCDASVSNFDDGIIEEVATYGDTQLGGVDFDDRLVSYCIAEFKRKHGKDPKVSGRDLCRIRNACERAKRTLSSAMQTTIEVDSVFDGFDLRISMTRTLFEELCADLFRQTIDIVDRVLRDACTSKDSIYEIVLVGGSTRIPKVQQLLKDFFDGKELCKSLNPDEAVAAGAAAQAAILAGVDLEKTKDMMLLDIVPFSYGIETIGGAMNTIMHRNSTIPCKKTKDFLNSQLPAWQHSGVLIRVYEGDHDKTIDNNLLEEFVLDDISADAGDGRDIDVSIDIDANRIIIVRAADKSTGKSRQVTLGQKAGISQDAIGAMIIKAQKLKEWEEYQHQKACAKMELEEYVYRLQDNMANSKDTASAHHNKYLGAAIQQVVEWVEKNPNASKEEYASKQKELEIAVKTPPEVQQGGSGDSSTRFSGGAWQACMSRGRCDVCGQDVTTLQPRVRFDNSYRHEECNNKVP